MWYYVTATHNYRNQQIANHFYGDLQVIKQRLMSEGYTITGYAKGVFPEEM